MSEQPQPPQRIYATWIPEVGEWDLWDEHYGQDDEAHVYVQQITEASNMSKHTEWLIAEVRSAAYKNADTPSGALMRALVDCADQRDELAIAVENFLQWCDVSNWVLPFDKELRAALAKVRPADE